MMRFNWWRVAKASAVLVSFGLVASVRAEGLHPTTLDAFTLTWPQMIGVLGFVGVLFAGAAELRRWMVGIDERLHDDLIWKRDIDARLRHVEQMAAARMEEHS